MDPDPNEVWHVENMREFFLEVLGEVYDDFVLAWRDRSFSVDFDACGSGLRLKGKDFGVDAVDGQMTDCGFSRKLLLVTRSSILAFHSSLDFRKGL